MKKIHQANLDEKQLKTKQVFAGHLLKLWVDQVELPNGHTSSREYIKHQGAVGILPILEDGRIVFVKQCRYAVDSVIYEIPAGKLEIGEDHLLCAQRELSEETGYSADSWQRLTTIVTTPGFTNEAIDLYVAKDLTLGEQHPDEDEFLEVVAFTPQEVRQMVINQEIFDAKTLSALLLYFYAEDKI